MKKVIVITGPTASGKTKLSIELAKYLNSEIINGDSVQIYKELNIGSAKIKNNEKENIKHHMLDITSVVNNYTVYHYQNDVRNLLNKIDLPIIVGGSGLYIKAALYNYEFSEINEKIPNLSLNDKIEYIKKNDPNLKIDFNNERRVNSAYQTIKSGFKRSEIKEKDIPLYNPFIIYLDINRKTLKDRLYIRLNQMLESGFVEEVKNLPVNELNIIGYKEIFSYLNKEISINEAVDRIITSSMRYAKKQKTWFKNQMKSHLYDALDPNLLDKIKRDLVGFLKE